MIMENTPVSSGIIFRRVLDGVTILLLIEKLIGFIVVGTL